MTECKYSEQLLLRKSHKTGLKMSFDMMKNMTDYNFKWHWKDDKKNRIRAGMWQKKKKKKEIRETTKTTEVSQCECLKRNAIISLVKVTEQHVWSSLVTFFNLLRVYFLHNRKVFFFSLLQAEFQKKKKKKKLLKISLLRSIYKVIQDLLGVAVSPKHGGTYESFCKNSLSHLTCFCLDVLLNYK